MKIGLALFEFIQSVYNPNDNQMLVSSNINESRYSELPYIFFTSYPYLYNLLVFVRSFDKRLVFFSSRERKRKQPTNECERRVIIICTCVNSKPFKRAFSIKLYELLR